MIKYKNLSDYSMYSGASKVACSCAFCGYSFSREKSKLKYAIKKHNQDMFYCSTECFGKSRKSYTIFHCSNCNSSLQRRPRSVSKSKTGRFFCNSSCAATYNNTHKTHGTRRSKMEAVLENYIKREFPYLTLVCNEKTAIGSELDFYFPDLKFAIELNGIYHYKPIHGQDKLDKIQANDRRKASACKSLDIELAVIDSSTVTRLTSNSKAKYSSIVKNLLDTAMSQT